MKIAILFVGQIRTLRKCIPNLSKFLLHLDAETFLYSDSSSTFEEEKVFCRNLFDHTNFEDDPEFADYSYSPGRIEHYQFVDWHRRIVSQIYKNWCAWKMISDKQYDVVIRVRPDIILNRKLEDLNFIKPSTLYIPKTDNHFGLNDRFGIGDYDVMKSYMCRYEDLDEYLNYGGILHSEENLKYTMLKNNHKFKPLSNLYVTIRRENEDVPITVSKYDKLLWLYRNIPHVRDKRNWTKAYENKWGQFTDPKY